MEVSGVEKRWQSEMKAANGVESQQEFVTTAVSVVESR